MQGFPSVGDVHSTVPVPKEKWFEYGGERSGRFQVCCGPDTLPAGFQTTNYSLRP